MKFLKIAIFILLALFLVFFLLGIVKSTISYGHTVTVDKPIEEAWAVQKDTSKFRLWLEGFKSMEHISGEPEAVGSKYKVIVNPGEGQPDFEMIETVVAFEPNDYVQLRFDSDMMVFDQTTKFLETNGKTKITTSSTVKANGFMMRSMFAMMELFGSAFQKQEAKNMEALKKVIEENTTDYFTTPPVLEEVIE